MSEFSWVFCIETAQSQNQGFCRSEFFSEAVGENPLPESFWLLAELSSTALIVLRTPFPYYLSAPCICQFLKATYIFKVSNSISASEGSGEHYPYFKVRCSVNDNRITITEIVIPYSQVWKLDGLKFEVI